MNPSRGLALDTKIACVVVSAQGWKGFLFYFLYAPYLSHNLELSNTVKCTFSCENTRCQTLRTIHTVPAFFFSQQRKSIVCHKPYL
ncbi:hypothetical protein XELAEV_18035223mg [Xenopus laevis]|uniref:Uncharacterized protein n=1 Tax=Xenopus laevis TaxID=8355 RepID=A0A974CFV1_XENLA|nr:hypothetical protein XELAEV_18035223mg [Xenopus laevis]